MFAGGLTASLLAPGSGVFATATSFLRTDTVPELFNKQVGLCVALPFVLATGYALYNLRKSYQRIVDDGETNKPILEGTMKTEESEQTKVLDGVSKLKPAIVAGTTFAGGLAVSGMIMPSKIFGFLTVSLTINKGTWDPTLMMVMMGGLAVSWLSYQYVSGVGIVQNSSAMDQPHQCSSRFDIPRNQDIDIHLIGGALCFGVGWAVSGLCPGPAIFLAASGCTPIIFCIWPSCFAGAYVAKTIKNRS